MAKGQETTFILETIELPVRGGFRFTLNVDKHASTRFKIRKAETMFSFVCIRGSSTREKWIYFL